MLDDVRNHDPRPSPEERDWMETGRSRFAAGALAAVLLAVALVAADAWVSGAGAPATSAAASSRAS